MIVFCPIFDSLQLTAHHPSHSTLYVYSRLRQRMWYRTTLQTNTERVIIVRLLGENLFSHLKMLNFQHDDVCVRPLQMTLSYPSATDAGISGFNQRRGEALPPQIFLTLKFVVWAKLQNYRNCATWCQILRLKRHQIRVRLGLRPRPH